MHDPINLAAIFGTFLLAGTVKGVIGLGLPTVSLGLLAVALDLPTAMALLLVHDQPVASSSWGKRQGDHPKDMDIPCDGDSHGLDRRYGTYPGEPLIVSALLGALLVAYAVVGLGGSGSR